MFEMAVASLYLIKTAQGNLNCGSTGVGSGGGGAGGHVPPPTFERGGAKICLCPPPHFQTQNLGLGIEPTDICDVTLAWLASRCWARQMCPPHTFCHRFLRRWVRYVRDVGRSIKHGQDIT